MTPQFEWRYREAPVCNILEGKFADLCFQTSDNTLWKCEPIGGINGTSTTPQEWHNVSGAIGALALQGNWDALNNTPDITGTTTTGYTWVVSVAGSTDLGGITSWRIGDMAVKTAGGWIKIDNASIAQTPWASDIDGGGFSLTNADISQIETDPVYSANTYAVGMDQGVSTGDDVSFNSVSGDGSGLTGVTADSASYSDESGYTDEADWSIIVGDQTTFDISGFSDSAGYVSGMDQGVSSGDDVSFNSISGDGSGLTNVSSAYADESGYTDSADWSVITGDQTTFDLSGFSDSNGYFSGMDQGVSTGDDVSFNTISGDGSGLSGVVADSASYADESGYTDSADWSVISGDQTTFDLSGFSDSQGYVSGMDQGVSTGDDVTFNTISGDGSGLTNVASAYADESGYTDSCDWSVITGDQTTFDISGFADSNGYVSGMDQGVSTGDDVTFNSVAGDGSSLTGVTADSSSYADESGYTDSADWAIITGDQTTFDLSGFADSNGYVSAMDQSVATGDDVTFNSISGDGSGLTGISSSVAWTDITGTQSDINLSGFTDDLYDQTLNTTDDVTFASLNINSAYSFPTGDGSLNDVLITDGAGNVTWGAAGGAHNILSDTHNDTASASVVRGDMFVGTNFSGVAKWYRLGLPAGGTSANGHIWIEDGADARWSYPTFPINAPTNKKVVMGNGTNYVMSTPTLPVDSAPAAGKIMRGDGTNWTATTMTYPDTITTGYIPYSTGTNVLGSASYLTYGGYGTPFTVVGSLKSLYNTTLFTRLYHTDGNTYLTSSTNILADSSAAEFPSPEAGSYLCMDTTSTANAFSGFSSLSFSEWINVSNFGSSGIYQIATDGGQNTGIWYDTADGLIHAKVRTASGTVAITGPSLSTSTKYHIGLTWTSGEVANLFVNGTKYSSSGTLSGSFNGTLGWFFGRTTATVAGSGKVQEIAKWTRKLTDAEMGDLYNGGTGFHAAATGVNFPSTSTNTNVNLIALFHLNYTQTDSSASGTTMVFYGAGNAWRWASGMISGVVEAYELNALKVTYNSTDPGVLGKVYLGYSIPNITTAGSETHIDGRKIDFDIYGSNKGVWDSTGLTISDVFKITPSAAPGTPAEGMFYSDSSTHHPYYYDGSNWKQLDASGGGGGITYVVVDKTADYTVSTSDLGYGNILTMSHATLTKTFTLPTLSSGDLGKPIMFVKKGVAKVVIQARTGQYIADSSSAGTIYDDAAGETYATIILVPITTTQWVIQSYDGTWSTT